MHHSLPARPAFNADIDETHVSSATLPSFPIQPIAGPSKPSPYSPTPSGSSTCIICSSPPKYTCPRCSLRTCSATCSKSHKDQYGCTGQRDPTAYVPLKEVGSGVWSDDYKWLEEGRRKVQEWGETLPKGSIVSSKEDMKRRGRGKGGMGDGRESMKRGLREKYGVDVEFMPEGMERRKKNQSSWNQKSGSLFLTVQLSVDSSLLPPPDNTKNRLVNHARVLFATSNGEISTLNSLLPKDLDQSQEELIYALPYHTTSKDFQAHDDIQGITTGKRFFPPLEPTHTVQAVLRGTAFVEFPTIHAFRKSYWDDKVKNQEYRIEPLHQSIPKSQEYREGRQVDSGWGQKRKAVAEAIPWENHSEVQGGKSAKAVKEVSSVKPVSLGLAGLGNYASEEEE